MISNIPEEQEKLPIGWRYLDITYNLDGIPVLRAYCCQPFKMFELNITDNKKLDYLNMQRLIKDYEAGGLIIG